MWSFIRISFLGICVAAGVAVAVLLAAHVAEFDTGKLPDQAIQTGNSLAGKAAARRCPQPTESNTEPTDTDAAIRDSAKSKGLPGGDEKSIESTDVASTHASQGRPVNPPPYQPAPYYMHYQPPSSQRLDRLEDAVLRVTEMSTQNQIRMLEEQVKRLADMNSKRATYSPELADTRDRALPNQSQAALATMASTADVPAATAATARTAARQPDSPSIQEHELPTNETNGLNLRSYDLRKLLEFLSAEAELNVLASENVKGNVTVSLSDMDAEEAIFAILRITGFTAKRDGKFLYVGTSADMERMEQSNTKMETRIYRTEYVTAAELQGLISPLLSSNGKITVSSPAETSIPSDTVQTGGDDFAGNEVVMVHDYATVLTRIDEIVTKIDKRPRQVMIEAMIVSVALDDSHSVGINFETFQKSKSLRLVSNNPLSNLGQISLTKGGLQFGVLDGNVAAFIDALEGIGDTNVIAAPHLLCLNKQRAEILIGDQKGYLSTTQTETATTQTVEFLDLGTQLRIRPFISADGMVRLEVHPELSTGDVKLIGSFALPEKTTTQVTTNIMCRDGCTVVIGGLIREDHARTVTQAAIIGNVPILGALFRNKKIEDQRSEIIVMLTPKIVQDPAECPDGSVCFSDVSQRRAEVELRRISPVARHHYSRRYYRLAQSAWYAGNLPEAHRYLEISLQMQPHNIMAKRLYSVMMSGEERLFSAPLGPAEFPAETPQLVPEEPESLPEVEPQTLQPPRRLDPPTPDQVRRKNPLRAAASINSELTAIPMEQATRPASADLHVDAGKGGGDRPTRPASSRRSAANVPSPR